MPHIPTTPLSYGDAAPNLENLGGPESPRDWQGALPFTYHIGPGPVRVKVHLKQDYRYWPIWDVIGKIPGTRYPNQLVVLGNHRDAWVYGAVDPNSGTAVYDAGQPDDVQEFHPWDPHKAAKDIEVGDFYFKRKNYRAALDRYREALIYKPNDAVANFRLAECEEKAGQPADAVTHYEAYLKILPHGPQAEDAQKGLARLKAISEKQASPK